MANKNAEFPKSIGEVAKQYNLTLRALRFWENEGLIKPQRDRGDRLYNEATCKQIEKIVDYKKCGFAITDIKKLLHSADDAKRHTLMTELVRKYQTEAKETIKTTKQQLAAMEELLLNN